VDLCCEVWKGKIEDFKDFQGDSAEDKVGGCVWQI
jgi:hypothetical protein